MERKEPTMSGLEPIAAPAARPATVGRTSPRKTPTPAQPRPAPQPAASQPPVPPRPVTKSSPLLPFAFILALTGLGLGGFVYLELIKVQQSALAAELRIKDLEGRLELSDDESSQSVAALAAKLKWADSEIRKLWGVAHDRNRKAIDANKASLLALKKTLTSVGRSLKSASADAGSAKKLVASYQAQLGGLEQSMAAYETRLALVVEQSSGQTSDLRELVDQSNRLDSKLKKLQSDLAGRVKTNEEAIEAIDAYRRTTNRELLQIQQRLNQVGSTP